MEGIIRHQIKLNEFEQKISEDVVEYSNNIEKVRKEIEILVEEKEREFWNDIEFNGLD